MAVEVTAEVVEERGQWTVYLLVLTDQGLERRAVSTHRSPALAKLAADVIRRTTARRRAPVEDNDDRHG
jgi:hypothetical protein